MRRNDREIKGSKKIEEIILQCKTCRVAMVDDGMPYVVPMSFGYTLTNDGVLELYFHSAREGRKLNVLRKNGKVCFEISYEGEPLSADTPCSSGYYFGSVIGYGEAVFIEDADEKCKALSIMFRHQTGRDAAFTAAQAGNVCVFKIVSADFTGKKKPRPDIDHRPS
ncbi:MAG: pyridoxamine 5'-phosphate oxidase family protein [Candidatus Methanoplasma sp.]|nr:pyridoxamine 5'-phosphate oxidase family protein [Candidatus Methanoplasma sp.]